MYNVECKMYNAGRRQTADSRRQTTGGKTIEQ